MTSTAEYRPALGKRRFAHDDLVAVDLFSGFGGLTKGINDAGFTTIMAAIFAWRSYSRFEGSVKIDVEDEDGHP